MNQRSTIVLFFLFYICISSFAQKAEWPRLHGLKLKEIRTASDRILVVYFLGPEMNEVKTGSGIWSLNGDKITGIERWITPNWEGVGLIPDIRTLPPQRQYLDNRKHVSANEFTVPESLAYPSVIYTILAQGGIWDKKTILKQ